MKYFISILVILLLVGCSSARADAPNLYPGIKSPCDGAAALMVTNGKYLFVSCDEGGPAVEKIWVVPIPKQYQATMLTTSMDDHIHHTAHSAK